MQTVHLRHMHRNAHIHTQFLEPPAADGAGRASENVIRRRTERGRVPCCPRSGSQSRARHAGPRPGSDPDSRGQGTGESGRGDIWSGAAVTTVKNPRQSKTRGRGDIWSGAAVTTVKNPLPHDVAAGRPGLGAGRASRASIALYCAGRSGAVTANRRSWG